MQAAGTKFGRYELREKVGEGGMAEVWKARNVSIGLVVAVKVLLRQFENNQDLQQRFLNEGRIQARLRHPNIVQVFDAGSAEGQSYLVMDFVEGETLEARLRRNGGRPLPISEVLSISSDILAALEYAHTLAEGPIIHRDVKPSNILLDREHKARLADFGIAVVMNQDRKTKVGIAPGSVHYMSPEQIQTPRSIDRRSDIYSFGCVLYEMLTGKPPFVSDTDSDFSVHQGHVYKQPEPLRKRNPNVPFEFEWIVLRALNKDREKRFSSAKEMAAVLRDPLAKSGLARPLAPAPPPAPQKAQPAVLSRGFEQIKAKFEQARSTPLANLRGKTATKVTMAVMAAAMLGLALWAFWPHSLVRNGGTGTIDTGGYPPPQTNPPLQPGGGTQPPQPSDNPGGGSSPQQYNLHELLIGTWQAANPTRFISYSPGDTFRGDETDQYGNTYVSLGQWGVRNENVLWWHYETCYMNGLQVACPVPNDSSPLKVYDHDHVASNYGDAFRLR